MRGDDPLFVLMVVFPVFSSTWSSSFVLLSTSGSVSSKPVVVGRSVGAESSSTSEYSAPGTISNAAMGMTGCVYVCLEERVVIRKASKGVVQRVYLPGTVDSSVAEVDAEAESACKLFPELPAREKRRTPGNDGGGGGGMTSLLKLPLNPMFPTALRRFHLKLKPFIL
ncbi:hypothetical protein BCR33DRAFT_39860 [Rhizoclosmatium globosum]|uniref:Uncharacterized protein n=1 Tax=Rhizoclosmatium globosum TaxID=329046 RepID=A0A1Y2CNT0_9FUNG|nr:hypothetical protein BCR33DRAFT_39860 [Rhizoclosmatium globosum]|eukprot:ORY48606.1 hypothetical protein BCR33DRAFT_39860 [Rhizoclosmatium globosum]